jgi:hypothetical protein
MLTSKQMLKMSEEASHMFDDIDGLISRYGFSNISDEISSGLFFCDDLESAEKVKEKVHEIIEKYDEYIGYTTEFISIVIYLNI